MQLICLIQVVAIVVQRELLLTLLISHRKQLDRLLGRPCLGVSRGRDGRECRPQLYFRGLSRRSEGFLHRIASAVQHAGQYLGIRSQPGLRDRHD